MVSISAPDFLHPFLWAVHEVADTEELMQEVQRPQHRCWERSEWNRCYQPGGSKWHFQVVTSTSGKYLGISLGWTKTVTNQWLLSSQLLVWLLHVEVSGLLTWNDHPWTLAIEASYWEISGSLFCVEAVGFSCMELWLVLSSCWLDLQ